MPSFIVIHPTVWPQYTNVRHRQTDRQDRQRCHSIGQTVLQTDAQKLHEIFCTCSLWPWLGPSLTIMQYITYFRFSRWRHIWPQSATQSRRQ